MKTIKKLLADIQAVNPDEIRDRLAALDAEEKELRRILRLRLASARKEGARTEAAPCKR